MDFIFLKTFKDFKDPWGPCVRVLFFKSPIAHTEPIFKRMSQLKLTDMYTCNLLKLYYKLYRKKLPDYFDNFLPEYGVYRHNLRNNLIRLPAIRCDFGKMNSKYQMHYRLRELASPSNPPHFPPLLINEDTLTFLLLLNITAKVFGLLSVLKTTPN